MFDVDKELANGEKLWFALAVGFAAFGIAALICTFPFLSLATMKLLFPIGILTYPAGFIAGWRYSGSINKWMSRR